jgi:hypothetical protein
MKYKVFENNDKKFVRSENYNYNFDKKMGEFIRWGKTLDDDPIMAPSCEIADIEISTVCNGIGLSMETRKPCPWCYKSNTSCGTNMSFEIYKKILDKLFIKSVSLMLDDGNIINVKSGTKVMLTNGSYINIDDIKEGDDISMDWIKSISD